MVHYISTISKEATEKFVGIESGTPDRYVPGSEGEQKSATRPAARVLTADTARTCTRDLKSRDHFLDDQLLSTTH